MKTCVALDFETANAEKTSACALGLVKFTKDAIIDEWASLIKTPTPYFHWGNIRIHGIEWSDVKDKKNFVELWDEIRTFIGTSVLYAHNAAFDIAQLRGLFGYYNIIPPEYQYLCTVHIARKMYPDLENHKLHTVASHLHFNFLHHDALDDARACAHIAMDAQKTIYPKPLEAFFTVKNL